MKILITGACGLLGAHVMVALSRRHDVVGVDRHAWWGEGEMKMLTGDLASPGFVADTVAAVSPDVLVHCAAMVSVDACEQDPTLAFTCNAGMTRSVARAVPPHCLVVYITTDGTFKGEWPFATEEEVPSPLTVYGRSKLQGEKEVQQATENHLVVRTNFYGWSSGRKPTAAEWLYHALEEGKPITLFDDFFFTPIYVVDFVERLELLVTGGYHGIFHLCGKERVSKYEFGRLMAQAAGLSMEHVRRGSIDDATMIAKRPKDMSLSSERFRRLTGVDMPGCMAGLRRFLADRGQPLTARFDAWELSHVTGTHMVKAHG